MRSAEATVAGGRIVDIRPRRHHRNDHSTLEALQRLLEGSPDDTLLTVLRRLEPVRWSELSARSELSSEQARAALDRQLDDGTIIALDPEGISDAAVLISEEGLDALVGRALNSIEDYVNQFPLRAGLPREDLRSRLKLPQRAFSDFQRRLVDAGALIERAGSFDLVGRQVTLTSEQESQIERLLLRLSEQGVRPEVDAGVDPELLEYLEAQGRIVRLAGGVNLARDTYDAMVAGTHALLNSQERATLAEVRDQLGTSRKVAQAFLERLDTEQITRRVGDARVLRR